MEKLDVAEVTEIAREAARTHSLPVEVVGAMFGGGSDYVEILVNVDDCTADPCRFSMGVFRNESRVALIGEIAEGLRHHLEVCRRAREELADSTLDRGGP